MRKQINRILTAALLLAIAVIFIGTMVQYGRNYAYGFFISYKDLMPRNATVFDDISARIAKLSENVSSRLFLRNPIRQLNAAFQLATGKKIISIAGNDMVKLKCGAYYGLFTGEFTTDKMEELASFAEKLKAEKGIDTVFSYCHSGLYEDGQLPAGMEGWDNNIECADTLLADFRARGVVVSDSRDAYRASGLTMDEAINKSDVHWSHKMALAAARQTVLTMNEQLGLSLDAEKLDIQNFDEIVYERLLMGEYGRRIGFDNVTPDDIHELWPRYDTHILYEELNDDVRREGTFREAVINEANLARDPDSGYSEKAYYIYSTYLAQTHIHNDDGEPLTALVFKDSYGTPLGAFLGLTLRDVYAVDLRSTRLTMEECVEKVNPDIVIFAYSQQTLREFSYDIAE